jgi:hypothetical protein
MNKLPTNQNKGKHLNFPYGLSNRRPSVSDGLVNGRVHPLEHNVEVEVAIRAPRSQINAIHLFQRNNKDCILNF